MAEDSVPQWNMWASMPEFELWKAVALTLGLDPDASNAFWWTKYPDDDEAEAVSQNAVRAEFQTRLKVAVANLPPAGELPLREGVQPGLGEDAPFTPVPRMAFAAFARDEFAWTMSPAVVAWAAEFGSQSKPSTMPVTSAANLVLVGALLALLMDEYGKQEAVLKALQKKFPGVLGLGESTVKHAFGKANERLETAKKNAESKAQELLHAVTGNSSTNK